jgi:hypothetical protein
MYEPPPGGPGDEHRPQPGGSGQSHEWPYADWFRQEPSPEYSDHGQAHQQYGQHGQENQYNPENQYGPDYREYDPGYQDHDPTHQEYDQTYEEYDPSPHDPDGGYGLVRHGGHRRPDPDWTAGLEAGEVAPDVAATSVDFIPPPRTSWNWALIAGIAFFLADTILMAIGFASPVGTGALILVIVIWLIGLLAVAVLWLRASPRFFARNPLAQLIRAAGSGDAMVR